MLAHQFYTPTRAHKFLAKLSAHINVEVLASEYILKSFYDSFDWRLYRQQLTAEFIRSGQQSRVVLRHIEAETVIAATNTKEVPAFASQFQDQQLTEILSAILKNRALLRLCSIDYQHYLLGLFNKKGQLIARISFEQYELINNRIIVTAEPGHEARLAAITRLMNQELKLLAVKEPVVSKILKAQGRKPKDYSAKLKLRFSPDQPAISAAQEIHRQLLTILRNNEHGVIHNTDSEFLHDFRVAVHKSQCALKQLKHLYPATERDYFLGFFNWLAEISNPSRDIDVQLLRLAQYQSALAAESASALQALQDFLIRAQQQQQQLLATALQSRRYLLTLQEWDQFLQHPPKPAAEHAGLAIKTLADSRIASLYSRFLHQAEALDLTIASTDTHPLRKTAKKLRYLLEFFSSLYPEKPLRSLTGHLKTIQDLLGNEHDNQVQLSQIQQFQAQLATAPAEAIPPAIMTTLIEQLLADNQWLRQQFNEQFAAFSTPENRQSVDNLFNHNT